MGLDFVEGLDNKPYEGIARFFSTEDFRIRHMSKALEEFLEIPGITIFMYVKTVLYSSYVSKNPFNSYWLIILIIDKIACCFRIESFSIFSL